MGAFYQTSTPQNIDYGYQLPTELMTKVIQTMDLQNDVQLNEANIMDDEMAKIKFLTGDRDRAQNILKGYADKTGSIVNDLYENPQDVRKRMGTIRTLGRDLKKNYTTGELGAIQGNYNDYYSWLKSEQERVGKEGGASPQTLAAAQKYYLDKFGSTNYDPATGSYNRIGTAPLSKFVNMQEKAEKYIAGTKAEIRETKWDEVSSKSLYKITHNNRDEWVDYAGLLHIARNAYNADLEAQASVNQDAQFGVIKDPAQFLQSAFDAAIDKETRSNIKREVTTDGNPVTLQLQGQAEARSAQARGFAHAERMQQLGDASAYEKEKRQAQSQARLELIKFKQEHPDAAVDIPPDPYGPAMPSGQTDALLDVYSGEELKMQNLHATVDEVRADITKKKADLAIHEKNGDKVLADELRRDISAQEGVLKTTEGIVTYARNKYYESNAFKSLSPGMQSEVKAYMGYLASIGKGDTPQSRADYSVAKGLSVDVPISVPGGSFQDVKNRGAYNTTKMVKSTPVAFYNALDGASTVMNTATHDAGVSNKYNAKGVTLNLTDPSMYQVFNDMMKYGNTSIYQPDQYGGKTATGQTRALADMKIDAGNMVFGWNTDAKFSIANLVNITGAGTASGVIESATALPTTNGNVRFKIKLKSEVGGKSIGNSSFNYYQIEGLNDNREIIVEVTGRGASQGFINRLRTDANPEVQKSSFIFADPNMADLRNKYLTALAPPPGNIGWGEKAPFGYGNVHYDVRKNSNGAAEITYGIGDKHYTIQYTNTHDAEMEMMIITDNLNNGDDKTKSETLQALRASAKPTGK